MAKIYKNIGELIGNTPGRLMLQIHDGNDIKVLWRNFQLTQL